MRHGAALGSNPSSCGFDSYHPCHGPQAQVVERRVEAPEVVVRRCGVHKGRPVRTRPCSSVDRASACEVEGRRFESSRGHEAFQQLYAEGDIAQLAEHRVRSATTRVRVPVSPPRCRERNAACRRGRTGRQPPLKRTTLRVRLLPAAPRARSSVWSEQGTLNPRGGSSNLSGRTMPRDRRHRAPCTRSGRAGTPTRLQGLVPV
jgi:hypothetical protein